MRNSIALLHFSPSFSEKARMICKYLLLCFAYCTSSILCVLKWIYAISRFFYESLHRESISCVPCSYVTDAVYTEKMTCFSFRFVQQNQCIRLARFNVFTRLGLPREAENVGERQIAWLAVSFKDSPPLCSDESRLYTRTLSAGCSRLSTWAKRCAPWDLSGHVLLCSREKLFVLHRLPLWDGRTLFRLEVK